jgi:hypothetical protein
MHAPDVQLSAREPLHIEQLPPGMPQAASVLPGLHELPLQQPEQLIESQMHAPDEQRWPAPQALFVPHLQTPDELQLSAFMPHAVHDAPLVPQVAAVGGLTQVPLEPPLQQPDGHAVASQTQLPDTQCLPAAHRAFAPHLHVPPAQVSARTGSHALHALPVVPHWATVGVPTHELPLQQPAQFPELQPWHAWPEHMPPSHEAQSAPPVPHCAEVLPVWHRPVPSQQPDAQLVASHLHTPATQCWPVAHGPLIMPHAHAPLVQRSERLSHAPHIAPEAPQLDVVSLATATQVVPLQHPPGHDDALHTHAPDTQVWPAAHAASVPHLHTPLVQVLVDPEHGPHARPPVPHEPAFCEAKGTHAPALQQPLGQLVASHTHAPPTQRVPLAQGAVAPHLQAPPVQRSDVAPQSMHAVPAAAHWLDVVGETQTPLAQQPPGQLAGVQVQLPPSQDWPAAHGMFVPHMHAPWLHALLGGGAHVVHAPPLLPQCTAELVWHRPLKQQPMQLTELQPLQAPAVQLWPTGQLWHMVPAVPQVPASVPGRQILPEQQPVQLVESHTQLPFAQCWPAPQAGPLPQPQTPALQLSE